MRLPAAAALPTKEASYRTVRVGYRVVKHASWSYANPLPGGPAIKGYPAFLWHLMDAWYEEDERVFALERDPYKDVDILPSSRHDRVVLAGVMSATLNLDHTSLW